MKLWVAFAKNEWGHVWNISVDAYEKRYSLDERELPLASGLQEILEFDGYAVL